MSSRLLLARSSVDISTLKGEKVWSSVGSETRFSLCLHFHWLTFPKPGTCSEVLPAPWHPPCCLQMWLHLWWLPSCCSLHTQGPNPLCSSKERTPNWSFVYLKRSKQQISEKKRLLRTLCWSRPSPALGPARFMARKPTDRRAKATKNPAAKPAKWTRWLGEI